MTFRKEGERAMTDYFDDWFENSIKTLPGQDLRPHREAIAKIESGGDYTKVGPMTKAGDRALGKYQVMARNLPEWSKEALGRVVTPREFLQNPELQDKVFDHHFGKALQERGPADAASIWFTGRPLSEGAKRRDVLGTTGESYVKQYLNNLEPAKASPSSLDDLNARFKVEFLDKEYPQEASTPSVSAVPSLPKTPSWGILQDVGNEMLLGRGTRIAPTAQAQKNIWEGIAAGLTPEQALGRAREERQRLLEEQEKAAQAWQAEHGGAHVAAQVLGQALPIVVGGAGVNAALRGVGTLAPSLAPAARFLAGTAGEGLGGIGGFGVRRASDVAAGALQGGVGNVIIGQDPTTGAEWGAGLGALTGWLPRTLTSPLRAVARPEVARAAESFIQAGGELPAAGIVSGPGSKIVSSLAKKGEIDAVENFNKMLADRIGARGIMETEGVAGLTPKVLAEARRQIDDGFNVWASARGVNVDAKLMTELDTLRKKIKSGLGVARPEVEKSLLKLIDRVEDVAMSNIQNGNFVINGRDFLHLITKDGVVDDMFKTSPAATPFAEKLKESLFSALERTVPEGKAEIQALRGQWKDLRRLEKVAPSDPTGIISPKKVAGRYGKLGDDFGQIAAMGNYLPNLDAAGNIKGRSKGFLSSLASHLAPGFGSSALGAGIGFGLAEHGLGWLPEALANPTRAAGVALGVGAGLGAKSAFGGYLSSPAFTQRVIDNTLRPQVHGVLNPMVPLIPLLSQREETWR